MFELLTQVVVKQAMLELVNGLLDLHSQMLEVHPTKHRKSNMIVDNTGQAVSPIHAATEWLSIAMKLLNLSAQATLLV